MRSLAIILAPVGASAYGRRSRTVPDPLPAAHLYRDGRGARISAATPRIVQEWRQRPASRVRTFAWRRDRLAMQQCYPEGEPAVGPRVVECARSGRHGATPTTMAGAENLCSSPTRVRRIGRSCLRQLLPQSRFARTSFRCRRDRRSDASKSCPMASRVEALAYRPSGPPAFGASAWPSSPVSSAKDRPDRKVLGMRPAWQCPTTKATGDFGASFRPIRGSSNGRMGPGEEDGPWDVPPYTAPVGELLVEEAEGWLTVDVWWRPIPW
jgi:hypothetical protein